MPGARSPASPAGQLRGVLGRWAWFAPILGIFLLGLFAYAGTALALAVIVFERRDLR